MQRAMAQFNQLDKRITEWMAKYGPVLLRVSVGIVFLWFGFLRSEERRVGKECA